MSFLHRTWAEIDLSALKHNLDIIKSQVSPAETMAVVKADAYGHSAELTAKFIENQGINFFAVSNFDEAMKLRSYGITKPILILGYTPVNLVCKLAQNNIIQCVFSKEYALSLSQSAQENNVTVKIHIKLDTGMGRIGFDCRSDQLFGLSDAIYSAKLEGFKLSGIFTHFCVSDRTPQNEDGFTDCQYSRFQKALSVFKDSGISAPLYHCCNSAASFLDSDKHLNLCRVGISLYGILPDSNLSLNHDFKPVMTLKSVVSMVKDIKAGDTVSYGRTFTAERDMRIATVSAGYADGYPRALSNKGYVLVNGRRAKIVGRICMDQFCIDVTDIPNIKAEDEVVLFGKDLSVDEVAEWCDTISYEIICGITGRVPRIPVSE